MSTKRTVKGNCPACGSPIKITITTLYDKTELIQDVIFCKFCGRVDRSMVPANGELHQQ